MVQHREPHNLPHIAASALTARRGQPCHLSFRETCDLSCSDMHHGSFFFNNRRHTWYLLVI